MLVFVVYGNKVQDIIINYAFLHPSPVPQYNQETHGLALVDIKATSTSRPFIHLLHKF